MESFSEYRKPLCKQREIIGYGYTSTIYKLGSSEPKGRGTEVLKEIYLSDEPFETSKRFNELASNIFLTEEPETKDLIVPFHNFDFCHNKLYMTFAYIPNTLYDSILQYSVDELKEIVRQVNYAITVINQTISHNDLTTRNVYIHKGKHLKVLIGDWGASQKNRSQKLIQARLQKLPPLPRRMQKEIEEKTTKEKTLPLIELPEMKQISEDFEHALKARSPDKNFFKQDLRRTIIAALYFSSPKIKFKDVFVKMKKYRIYDSFNAYYEKEQRYMRETFPYRPKEFVEDLFGDAKTFEWQLIRYIYQKVGEKFFLEDIILRKDMKEFLDTLQL